MRIDTKIFELSQDQTDAAMEELELAALMDKEGKPGIIIAQICQHVSLSGKKRVLCEFMFLHNEVAKKVIETIGYSEFENIVAEEEEFPGPMPDEMWSRVKEFVAQDDKEAVEEMFRLAVKITKRKIKERCCKHIKKSD